jgi:hypothetical protein
LTSSATCNSRSLESRSYGVAAAAILLSSAALAATARWPGANQPLVVLGSARIPELCLFHRVTGRRCPGCGMSRAFVLLWRGRIQEAIRSNPASPFLFATLFWLALRPVVHPDADVLAERADMVDSHPDVASSIKSSLPARHRS